LEFNALVGRELLVSLLGLHVSRRALLCRRLRDNHPEQRAR
jgi:hypothetical protein